MSGRFITVTTVHALCMYKSWNNLNGVFLEWCFSFSRIQEIFLFLNELEHEPKLKRLPCNVSKVLPLILTEVNIPYSILTLVF